MSKKLVAKTGEYMKDGQLKGRYTTIGVFLQNDNGEYLLLDPSVSLAGVLAKQNELSAKNNQPMRGNVMCGVFEDQPQQNRQQNRQQPQQTPQAPAMDDFSDDIPF